jgi:Ca-activated chloride channel family protein
MSFVNTHFLIYALLAIILITIILNRLNSAYFKWVKTYWFFERTWASRLSSFFYLLSILLFMLALLDLRGPEKKIKANLPDQRTIILLDTSSSMLAEDVRPNRFIKSLQIARHFVKNAPGHQISIVLFSDIQKRLLPFTDDIDLVDSRLAALEKTNSNGGGSNISQAIEEAIQYFEFDTSGDDKSGAGNVLVFTDAEESEGEFKVKIPSGINLGVIGVGTLKGSNIPLRAEDGSFRGYKMFKGTPVITKLDEAYIQKIGIGVKNFKYWIVNSYSLPTEDIMNFFRSAYNNKLSTGDVRIRPVYSHYILIPAILFFCLSVLIGRAPIFKIPKMILFAMFISLGIMTRPSFGQEQDKKGEVVLSPEIKKDLETIKEGKADREYVLKTAEKMLRAKDVKSATELYNEYSKKSDSEKVRFNHATSLLKSNRLKEALPIIQDLMKNSKDEDLKDKLRKNLSLSVDQKKKQEKEQQKDKDKKDQKENEKENKKEDQQNSKDQKDDKDKKNQENQKDNNKDKKDKKDGNEKPEDKKDSSEKDGKSGQKEDEKNKENSKSNNESKPKDKKEGNEGKENKKEEEKKESEDKIPQGPRTLEEKEKEIEQKRRMVKTPAMIKQIMSDDRELQKKMMNTSTSERGEQKQKRDW